MKTLFYLLVFSSCCKLQAQSSGTNNLDLTNNQITGYSLFGLGFTTVAYTYTNYADVPDASRERTLYYSIGAGMVLTGLAFLIASPGKKHKSNAWSSISLPHSPSHFARRNWHAQKSLSIISTPY